MAERDAPYHMGVAVWECVGVLRKEREKNESSDGREASKTV